jgi:hypothetical protein
MLTVHRAFADEAPYPMYDLLLNSQLIAHVKISSHSNKELRVEVKDILRNYRTGIKKGDYLKVDYDFDLICPQPFPVEYAQEHKEGLAFLRYTNGTWHLVHGVIAFWQNGLAEVNFSEEGCTFMGDLNQWRSNLNEYYQHFWLDEEQKLKARYQQQEVAGKELGALATLQYVGAFHLPGSLLKKFKSIKVSMVEPPPEPEPELVTDSVYTYLRRQPISADNERRIMEELITTLNTNHPELKAHQVAGITAYQVVFEANGRVAEVAITRSVSPTIDKAIKQYYNNNPQWRPAINSSGRAVKYRQLMVLRYLY